MPIDLRIISFRQTFSMVPTGTSHDVLTFPGGLDPILVERNKRPTVITQTGECVCWQYYMIAPGALEPDRLLGEPQISYSKAGRSPFEFRTTWTYVFTSDELADADLIAQTNVPPLTPTFVPAS